MCLLENTDPLLFRISKTYKLRLLETAKYGEFPNEVLSHIISYILSLFNSLTS
jgi:hypothetical protein